MTATRTYGALLLSAAAILATASAQAQTNDLSQRPTLSPWFGLYQRNSGPLDNYHTFVRPKTELIDTLHRQQSAIQYNNAGLNSLSQDMLQLQEPGAVRPTGTGSVFMNYSHYYPAKGTSSQATASATTTHRRNWSPSKPSAGRSMH